MHQWCKFDCNKCFQIFSGCIGTHNFLPSFVLGDNETFVVTALLSKFSLQTLGTGCVRMRGSCTMIRKRRELIYFKYLLSEIL